MGEIESNLNKYCDCIVKIIRKLENADRVWIFNVDEQTAEFIKEQFRKNYVTKDDILEFVKNSLKWNVSTIHDIPKILEKNFGTATIPASQELGFRREATEHAPIEMGQNGTVGFKMGQNREEIDFQTFVNIIKRILPNDGIRPRTALALYALYLNGMMSKEELKAECEKLNKQLGLNYSISSIRNAISEVVNNTTLVNKHVIEQKEYFELTSALMNDIKFYLSMHKEDAVGEIGDLEELIGRFISFFRNYSDDSGRKIYLDKLVSLLTVESSKSLVIDWTHLNSYDPDVALTVLENPDEAITAAEHAIQVVLREEFFKTNPPKFYARFTNLIKTLKVREIRSNFVNKLIEVEGIVSRQVDYSPFPAKAVFVCKDCGHEMIRLQKPFCELAKPAKCEQCGSKNIELDEDKSVLIDAQLFRIQDLPEGNMRVRFIDAVVTDDLVDTFTPGDRVRVTGVYRVKFMKKNASSPIMRKILEVNHIEVLSRSIVNVEVDESRVQQIKELAKRPDIVDLIVKSIAPSICGYEDIKKGIALALFSGGDVVAPDGTVTRGASHVLLIGDPGTAKTTITRFLKQVIPRGVWTTAKTSSAAGLTASAVKDEQTGEWVLEAGALVLANGGICIIDEIDKMNDKDRVAIHEALEQGTISISKAGNNVTLPAKATVIAIGNPRGGRFNLHGDKTLIEQIDLPPTLLSRFDLIFTIVDLPDEKTDREVAHHIIRKKIGVAGKSELVEEEYIPADLLRDYIAYARNNFDPVLTPEAATLLEEYYVKVRNRAKKLGGVVVLPLTARQLEGIWRLARARMRLSNFIEAEDVKDVIELVERVLKNIAVDEEGTMDIPILEVGKSSRRISIEETILNIIEKLQDLTDWGAPIEDIIKEASRENIERKKVIEVIGDLMEAGRVYSPRDGFYKVF